MKRRIPPLFVVLSVLFLTPILVATFGVGPSAAGRISPASQNGAGTTAAPAEPPPDSDSDTASTRVYIVRLSGAPLASYRGDIPGLAATSPDRRGGEGNQAGQKLDVQSDASVAYLDHLSREHDQMIATIEQAIGRSIEVLYRYTTVYNGISVRLTEQEAAVVARLDGVDDVQVSRKVTLETDAGPEWIGAPAVWEDISSVYGLNNTRGEGMIAGLVDTGITLDHPSFAATGDDGYTHINPKGAGTYLGWCDPEHSNYDPDLPCNEKAIGVYVFDIDGVEADGSDLTPLDLDGHGTHVGSIMAGNVISDVVLRSPTPVITFPMISGVAPHASIISYKQDGESASLVAAIEQAIEDGVDVINHSLGDDPLDPWEDAVAVAYLNARNAGVFVAKSAGNQGPSANTITSPGAAPWLTTIGFASHDRAIRQNGLVDLSGGDTTPPSNIDGGAFTSAYGPAPIVHYGICNGVQPGTFDGEIVVCDFPFVSTIDEILEEGGAGGFVLVVPSFLESLTTSDRQYTFPGVFISSSDGEALETWLASGSGHQATIRGISTEAGRGDVMDSRSSRGPNGEAPDILKPDMVAPGTTIVGAYPGEEGGFPAYHLESGSSMATPHVAGAAALIRAAHPDWSPAEIQSALMLTANYEDVVAEDETSPAPPFDRGAGRMDVSRAVGAALVLDEDQAGYEAANPTMGGDPTTLNLASLTDGDCDGMCSWSREVKSTWSMSLTWTVEASSESAISLTIEPELFTLEPGATQSLSVTTNTDGLTGGEWVFGTLTLTPWSGSQVYTGTPPLHLPVVVRPSPGLVIHKTGPAAALLGETIVYTLTVENTNADVAVNDLLITDELPEGTTYIAGSGGTYNDKDNTVSWTLDTLAAGSTQSVAFAVMATTTATVTNDTYHVTVGEVSPVMGEAVTTVISEDLDVDISKSGPEVVTFGEPVTYTLAVQNNRTDSPVYNLTVTDEVPAGTTYLDGSGGDYSDSDNTVSWMLDMLEAGDSENLVFAVTPYVTGTVVNESYGAMIGEVMLASGTPITTEVLMETSLTIHKSGPAEAMTEESIVYTLTVSNTGDHEVAGIAISDELPAGTTYVEGSGGTYNESDNTVSWTLDTLAAGSSQSVAFAVMAAAAGDITNDTYQVTAEGFYPAAGEQAVTTSVSEPFNLEERLVNEDPSVLNLGPATQDIPVGTASVARFGFTLTNPQENDQGATFLVLGSGNTWPTTSIISSTTPSALLAVSAGEDLPVSLAVGESAEVSVEMELPEDAQPGDSDTVQMTVRLQDGTPGQQAEFPLTVNLTESTETGSRIHLPLLRK